jgi:hypothetical protein
MAQYIGNIPPGTVLGNNQSTPRPAAPIPMSSTLDVKHFGCVGDGVANDTACLQAAITAGANKVVFLPPGTYLTSAPLTVPAQQNTCIVGSEVETTVIKNLSNTDGVVFAGTDTDNYTTAGCIRNLTILANTSIDVKTPGSAGTGLKIQARSDGFTADNLRIFGFATGASFDRTWYNQILGVNSYYTSVAGFSIGCDATFPTIGGGNKFERNHASNNGTPIASNTSDGWRTCRSGGNIYVSDDATGNLVGLRLIPAAGTGGVVADVYVNFQADTSASDGVVLDSTNGIIDNIQFTNLWAGSNNGSGFVTKGPAINSVTVNGFAVLANALYGFDLQRYNTISIKGGSSYDNARCQNAVVAGGSGYTTASVVSTTGGSGGPAYFRVFEVAGGGAITRLVATGTQQMSSHPPNPITLTTVSGPGSGGTINCTWATENSAIRLAETNTSSSAHGFSWQAGYAIVKDNLLGNQYWTGTDTCILVPPGAGQRVIANSNECSASVRPWTNQSDVINFSGWATNIFPGSSTTAVAAGSTVYLSGSGQAGASNAWIRPLGTVICQYEGFNIHSDQTPAAGQSYTTDLLIGSVTSVGSAAITPGQFGVTSFFNHVAGSVPEFFNLRLTTSAGGPAATFRYNVFTKCS